MDDFALVRLGILDEEQVVSLVHAFFRYNHHMFVSKRSCTLLTTPAHGPSQPYPPLPRADCRVCP
jgi:hypothetical protein